MTTWPGRETWRTWLDRLAGRPAAARPPDMEELVAAVHLGSHVAGAAHSRLRPLLRSVAASRLRRHGVELDRDRAAAAELLGADLAAFVAADAPHPPEAFGPGVRLDVIDAHLTRLEAL